MNDDEAPSKRKRDSPLVFALIGAGLFIWAFSACIAGRGSISGGGTSGASSAPRPLVGISDARRICEKYVIDRLKAPATAKFSPASETPGGDTGHGWVVTGYVDSQNGFGALIRSKYGCQVTFTGMNAAGSPSWTLDNLALIDP